MSHQQDTQPCRRCFDDAAWMVAESMHRIRQHPDFDEGWAPYELAWQLENDEGSAMYEGHVHFNSLHEALHDLPHEPRHRVVAGRTSFFNYIESGGDDDAWDFDLADGGRSTKAFDVECTFGGPGDAGAIAAKALGLWEGLTPTPPWLLSWRVTRVQPDGRRVCFRLHGAIRKWDKRHAGDFLHRLAYVEVDEAPLHTMVRLVDYEIRRAA